VLCDTYFIAGGSGFIAIAVRCKGLLDDTGLDTHIDMERNTPQEGAIVYVTAESPYGTGEVWALHEMLALSAAGCKLLVIPRTARGDVFHRDGESLLQKTVAAPFMGTKVLAALVRACFLRPRQLVGAVSWTWRKSVDSGEFVKGLVVVPKCVYLADILKTARIRHIHAHSTTTVANVASVLARLLGCSFSFTLHTSVIAVPVYTRQFHTLLESAQFVRVISKEVGDKLLRIVGNQYADKIVVLPLGVDCHVEPADGPARQRPFTILTPAALLPHKGHGVALRACRVLMESGINDFKWIFCGDGPLKSEIQMSIRQTGLSGVVELCGMVPNDRILEWYKLGQVDVVILPSVAVSDQHEGIPHALMQAMSYGIPVCSTDSGGTLELIGGGAGVFVPQGDVGALARAVEKLMCDDLYRRSQGERGRAKVKTEFDADTTAKTLLTLFTNGPRCDA